MVILIIIGAPIWFSILASLLMLILLVYASLWSAVIALWAVFAALSVSGPVSLVAAAFLMRVSPFKAMFIFGAALMCIGMAVLVCFFGTGILAYILAALILPDSP